MAMKQGLLRLFPLKQAAISLNLNWRGIEIKAFFVYPLLEACIRQAEARIKALATR